MVLRSAGWTARRSERTETRHGLAVSFEHTHNDQKK
jgi:hypothetical protein